MIITKLVIGIIGLVALIVFAAGLVFYKELLKSEDFKPKMIWLLVYIITAAVFILL